MQRIQGFWDTNATILLVSHELQFLEKSCERVIWLDKGRVRLMGESGMVVAAYLESVGQQNELRLEADASALGTVIG
ncbi:MAG TPA: hypothetical protein V6D18_06595 [Thermosynechococcaceae cyanobacterium]